MGIIKTIPTREPGTILRSDRGRWTYEDLQQIGETQDPYEIIEGVLYKPPSAHVLHHQSAVGNLYFLLRSWADDHDAGEVFLSPADVKLTCLPGAASSLTWPASMQLARKSTPSC